jgi:hypothetical protein
VGSGLASPCLASTWPGLASKGRRAAQCEIFSRWCKESVASSVENPQVYDSIRISRVGVCLAQDGPRTTLRPGWRATSHTVTVRFVAVRCVQLADWGGKGGEGGEARSKMCVLVASCWCGRCC